MVADVAVADGGERTGARVPTNAIDVNITHLTHVLTCHCDFHWL